MIITKSSHPDDQDLNVRMTTNFPESGIIVRSALPALPAEHVIGSGRQMIVFSGKDRRQLSDLAANSFLASTANRTAMSTAFGRIPFLKRIEERVPSGCFLMGVPGNQVDDENRQALFKNFCAHEPHLHVFEDLATSDYFLCARRGFLLNFGVIATFVGDLEACFTKISKMPLLAEAEKEQTGWSVVDRLKLIRIIHENVDETQRFQAWFHDEKIEEKTKLNSLNGANVHAATGALDA